MQKILNPNIDRSYDEVFLSLPDCLKTAVNASGLCLQKLFHMSIEDASSPAGETMTEWLAVHFSVSVHDTVSIEDIDTRPLSDIPVPEYEYARDVIEQFDAATSWPGEISEERLQSIQPIPAATPSRVYS